MALVPHERSLVEKFEGKPFVLLGVNGDESPEVMKTVIKDEDINWRSWYGGYQAADIPRVWRPRAGWPTIWVIDHTGVIRYEHTDLGNDRKLERVISKWVQEAELADKGGG
jgi:hypothetical protein